MAPKGGGGDASPWGYYIVLYIPFNRLSARSQTRDRYSQIFVSVFYFSNILSPSAPELLHLTQEGWDGTAGLPFSYKLGRHHNFCCGGSISNPRPVLDFSAQTTRDMILDFCCKT